MAKPRPGAPTGKPRGLAALERIRDALPEAPLAARDPELEDVIAAAALADSNPCLGS